MSELKPCPFCEAGLLSGTNVRKKSVMRHPHNPKCPLSEANFLDTPGFRESWNRRVEPANNPLTLEELNARTKPVWTPVPNASWIPEGGYYCLCNNGVIIPPSGLSFQAEERDWTFLDHKPEVHIGVDLASGKDFTGYTDEVGKHIMQRFTRRE